MPHAYNKYAVIRFDATLEKLAVELSAIATRSRPIELWIVKNNSGLFDILTLKRSRQRPSLDGWLACSRSFSHELGDKILQELQNGHDSLRAARVRGDGAYTLYIPNHIK